MNVVLISRNHILLVGRMHKDISYSDEAILFDFEMMEFSLLEDLRLKKKSCFPNKYSLFFGDFAYNSSMKEIFRILCEGLIFQNKSS